MNKETIQFLQQLADKLGTSTQYLLDLYTKQAFISGITHVVQDLLIVVACIAWFKAHKKFSDADRKWSYYRKDNSLGIPMAVIGVVLAILVICMFFCISGTITAFTNPRYWAVEHLFSIAK